MKNLIIIFLITISNFHSQAQDTVCTPTFKDIFNYNIGDKYTYLYTNWDGTSGNGDVITTYSSSTFEVTDKITKGDTCIYIINGSLPVNSITQNIYYPYEPISYTTDTLFLIDSIQHALNQCNDSLVPFLYLDYDTIYTKPYIETIDTLLVKTLGNPNYNFHFVEGELQPYYGLFYYETYANNIGLFYKTGVLGEYSYEIELANYIKNGDTVVFTTATHEYSFIDKISLYPNPVTDLLTIHLEQSSVIKSLKIYTVSGELIYQKNELIPGNIFTIDMSSYDERIYIVVIETEFDRIIKKITRIRETAFY